MSVPDYRTSPSTAWSDPHSLWCQTLRQSSSDQHYLGWIKHSQGWSTADLCDFSVILLFIHLDALECLGASCCFYTFLCDNEHPLHEHCWCIFYRLPIYFLLQIGCFLMKFLCQHDNLSVFINVDYPLFRVRCIWGWIVYVRALFMWCKCVCLYLVFF